MSLFEAQRAFYTERVPEQFNRTLERQRALARDDADAARLLEEMEAVRTAIVVQVDARETTYRHAFEIENGEMRRVDEPTQAPFLILNHALEVFPNLKRECGDSLLGFLGGLAGLGDEMRLTSQRVRSLRALRGSLEFERVGPGGFVLIATLGVDAPEASPRTAIRLEEDIYNRLRSGMLDPQDAFLNGMIDIEGDVEMAVGLALAALSPD
jgi:hypothetical protein